MIAIVFLASAASLQSVDHAAHHPPRPLVYLECPSMGAALDAYEHAPLVRMVRDEAVREVSAKVEAALGFEISQWIGSALEPLGASVGDDADPLSESIAQLRTVRSFSLSRSFDERERGETKRALEQMGAAIAQLDRIAELVEGHEREHGVPPESLARLGLSEALSADPWGRAWIYSTTADGAFELRTLGRDGAEGGRGADADLDLFTDYESTLEAEVQDRIGLQLVVEFVSADAARAAMEWFGRLGGRTPMGDPDAQREWRLERYQPSRDSVPAMTLATRGAVVVIGGERLDADALQARVSGARPSLSTSKLSSEFETRLGEARGVTVLRGFADSNDLTEALDEAGSNAAAGAADLTALQRLGAGRYGWRLQLVGERYSNDLVWLGDRSTSLLGLMGDRPAPREALSYVPADAVGFFAVHLESDAVRARVAALLAGEDEDGGGAAKLKSLEEKHGFDLDRDICSNLKGGAAGYLLPITGIGLPNIGLVADLRDPASFERGARGLFAALAETEGLGVRVRETKYRDAPMWIVSFDSEGQNAQFAAFLPTPTLTIVGGRVLISLTSLRAKKEVKRALGEESEPHPIASDLERFPAEASYVGWMDWAATVDGLYGMARSAAAAFGGQLDLGFDLPGLMTALPESSRVFTRFFDPTTLSVRPVDGGYLMRWDTSFGPETWLSVVGMTLAVPLVKQYADSLDAPDSTPSAEDEASQLDRDRTAEALRALSSRIVVFKLDQSRYPESLDELARPTTNYPRGFLEGLDVAADAWGHAYEYERSADGAAFRLWSRGPDGADARGAGDDLLAP